jgi:hypothetical protein
LVCHSSYPLIPPLHDNVFQGSISCMNHRGVSSPASEENGKENQIFMCDRSSAAHAARRIKPTIVGGD